MVYSFTQVSNYLRCPRSYRYRYLDGWRKRKRARPWLSAAALTNAAGRVLSWRGLRRGTV